MITKLIRRMGADDMTRNFEIVRLEGCGITARIVDKGAIFTTFKDFAIAAGYPTAVNSRCGGIEGRTVEVLAKGRHDFHGSVIYVIEDRFGNRYLIEDAGLEITETKEIASLPTDGILDAYERGYAKGKADAMAEMRRVLGE